MIKDYTVPIEIQGKIGNRVNVFNKKHMSKTSHKYYVDIRGKFVYLMRETTDGSLDRICRLTYNGDIDNMDFAIFKYSTEKYDPKEFFFPGEKYIDGTIEGAMKAGLKAYPI